ncbi:MAG: asparagine synthetase B, partial [Mycobacteriaceae bacterium]|nr:asparagine synthetase B [Mycobacteriaceae bacterium]
MCGLLAFVAATASAAPAAVGADAAEAVARAAHFMHHRGPDELGIWTDPSDSEAKSNPATASDTKRTGAILGFNRLSIIDIAHSHQPLRWGPPEHPDRYVLVFNGEIYNYLELRAELGTTHGAIFATEGDGEAIVAAYHYWGTDALNRLRGMFAFALWDTLTCELFCARDPFGIKPLFLATGSGGVAVASEKKCLLDLAELVGFDTAVDRRAVQHYTV